MAAYMKAELRGAPQDRACARATASPTWRPSACTSSIWRACASWSARSAGRSIRCAFAPISTWRAWSPGPSSPGSTRRSRSARRGCSVFARTTALRGDQRRPGDGRARHGHPGAPHAHLGTPGLRHLRQGGDGRRDRRGCARQAPLPLNGRSARQFARKCSSLRGGCLVVLAARAAHGPAQELRLLVLLLQQRSRPPAPVAALAGLLSGGSACCCGGRTALPSAGRDRPRRSRSPSLAIVGPGRGGRGDGPGRAGSRGGCPRAGCCRAGCLMLVRLRLLGVAAAAMGCGKPSSTRCRSPSSSPNSSPPSPYRRARADAGRCRSCRLRRADSAARDRP